MYDPDVAAEHAQANVRVASNESLITVFASLTHQMTRLSSRYDDLRLQRDIVEAEILRRMGVGFA